MEVRNILLLERPQEKARREWTEVKNQKTRYGKNNRIWSKLTYVNRKTKQQNTIKYQFLTTKKPRSECKNVRVNGIRGKFDLPELSFRPHNGLADKVKNDKTV